MKSILISIKSKYVAKILNGEKTIEIRKKFPKDYKGWVYVYCTKDRNDLVKFSMGGAGYKTPNFKQDYPKIIKWIGNGKVVARFYCDKVEEIKPRWEEMKKPWLSYYEEKVLWFTDTLNNEELLKKCCLTNEDIDNYTGIIAHKGYAIHISNLEIFDKPKELSEFCVKRSPQNFQYIEIE